ncbi:MAG: bile acid:sodium symporter [Candidatus Electrothrix sp. ATG1]|nr:bile acid:sodium symporter [Candidatus Electrothrix sp. ATG1]
MRQIFLPIGLVLAALFALLLPQAGIMLAVNNGIKCSIFTIFLVSGYQTGVAGTSLDRNLIHIFLTAAAISLFLAPLLGLGLGILLRLPPYLVIGLLIICAVPPTLSSGVVITGISGGNTVLALMLTIGLNLTGILTVPVVLHFCIKASGPISIDRWALFIKMLLLVLFPFVIGRLLRTLQQKQQVSPNWSYVNSSCVILTVYISLAASRQEFFRTDSGQYLITLISVSLAHFLLLAINCQAGKLLKLNQENSKALLFVASQKTLPVSLAVLASLRQETGNAVIVCLLFHFVQLFGDSILASRLRFQDKQTS